MFSKERISNLDSIWLSPYIVSTVVYRKEEITVVIIKVLSKDYSSLVNTSASINYKKEVNTFYLSEDKKVLTKTLYLDSKFLYFNTELQIKSKEVVRYCDLLVTSKIVKLFYTGTLNKEA